MPKSHKTVGIKLLIDEATLRAIGHVAAQWAVLARVNDIVGIITKRAIADAAIDSYDD